MKRNTLARVSLLLFTFLLGAFAEDKIIVRADPAALKLLAQVYSNLGVKVGGSLDGSGQVAVLTLPSGPLGSWIANLMKQYPGVLGVEPDAPVKLPLRSAAGMPASAMPKVPPLHGPKSSYYNGNAVWGPYVNQPAAGIVGIDAAQRLSTGRGALVATIDTGVDFSHPALRGSLVPGIDLTRMGGIGDESSDLNQETTPILDQETTPILDGTGTIVLNQETTPILDQETTPILDQETTPILDSRLPPALGHGTMVAGLIHLVAPDAMIMPVKAFDANGSASVSQVIAAIYIAVMRGADVINMSFSTTQPSDELRKAISYAVARGVICVAAVGNDGREVSVYPAAYDSIVGVGSTDGSDMRSSFSNFGAAAMLAAPGEGVITTYPRNRYAAGWGTSFSTPLVSGAAAMLVQLSGKISISSAVKDLSQAVPVGQGLGAGRLDLVRALNYQLVNKGR